MSYKFVTIAIEHATGEISRMQIIVEAPVSAFDSVSAVKAGFIFDKTANTWKRALTPDMLRKEITRTKFSPNIGAPTRFKKVRLNDFPTIRQNYETIPEDLT